VGRRLFSLAVCWKAPYFRTVRPVFVDLGTTLDVSLPATHRWIPKGMAVSYLATAETDLRAVATVHDLTGLAADESLEVVVPVDVLDTRGTTVVHADITMWVSPRRGYEHGRKEEPADAPAAGPRR
jgi:hypothetical protein